MKISKRLYRVTLLTMFFSSMLGCFNKEDDLQNVSPAQCAEVAAKKIKEMMWEMNFNDSHPMIYLDEILSCSPDEAQKYFIIKEVSNKFLDMTLSLRTQLNANGSFENYLNFMSGILWRQQKHGFSEDERIAFFWKGMEKYGEYVTADFSDNLFIGREQWQKLDRILMCRRDGFVNSMKFMKRNLFDYYLKGVGEEKKEMIECRFLEWYEQINGKIKVLEEQRLQYKKRLSLPSSF